MPNNFEDIVLLDEKFVCQKLDQIETDENIRQQKLKLIERLPLTRYKNISFYCLCDFLKFSSETFLQNGKRSLGMSSLLLESCTWNSLNLMTTMSLLQFLKSGPICLNTKSKSTRSLHPLFILCLKSIALPSLKTSNFCSTHQVSHIVNAVQYSSD